MNPGVKVQERIEVAEAAEAVRETHHVAQPDDSRRDERATPASGKSAPRRRAVTRISEDPMRPTDRYRLARTPLA